MTRDQPEDIAGNKRNLLHSDELRAELDRRLDAYEANPENVLTWNQVLSRLRERGIIV